METLYILFHNSMLKSLKKTPNSIFIVNDRKNLSTSLFYTDFINGVRREYIFDFKGEEIIFKIKGALGGDEIKCFKTFKAFIEGLDLFVNRWSNPSQINLLLISALLDITNGTYATSNRL